jgi:tetratricopeptide (TPR) repeat protein
MGNLALIYLKQGRLKEAEELGARVLEKRKKISGDNHPDTLMAMGNLAVTYVKLGRTKEAQKLEYVILERREKLLPDTLLAMANLAENYRQQAS